VAAALAATARRMGGVAEITGTRGPGAGGGGELRVTIRLSAGAGSHDEWARRVFGEQAGRDPVLAERVDSVLLVTEELRRAVITVEADANWERWFTRWDVRGTGQTPGQRTHGPVTRWSRRRALALAAQWCEQDGGHEPTAPGAQRCRWCPTELPAR
jgi:hypothetical protein